MDNLVRSVFIWWALAVPLTASAQGLGSFVSPGALCSGHSALDTLTGCPSCHSPGRGPTPERCTKCHTRVKQEADTNTGFHAGKGETCGDCHPEHRGTGDCAIPAIGKDFDHQAETGWPLDGAHERINCVACHPTPDVYGDLDTTCTSCHRDVHGADHTARALLQACDTCHDAESWDALPLPVGVFDHTSPKDADYLLDGRHLDVPCAECHFEMRFVPVEHDTCTSCHANPHRSEFRDQKCESCHAEASTWVVNGFDHDRTGYPLEGEHAPLGCDDCHAPNRTSPLASRTCDDCHTDLHHGQFASAACESCHTVQVPAFALRDWDHDTTDFPLVGQHRDQTCEDCHGDRDAAVYVDLPHGDCDDCHGDAHQGRFQPTDCAKCHISDGFAIQVFDHGSTDFPHTGKHVGLACNQCHRDFQWNGIPHGSCDDCHYTRNPHQQPTSDACDDCHVTDGFDLVRFDHLVRTGFDLAPAHDDIRCVSCHPQVADFSGLDPRCETCHVDDRPWGHYPGTCDDCHTSARWSPAGLGDNGHDITGFALVGAHRLEPCESCHADGRPRGEAEPDCVSCHFGDDAHQNLMGSACDDCHSETSWLRTSWRHATTGRALRGVHRITACVECHATSYVGTPTECFWCHQSEAPLTEPAHLTSEFLQCDTCHRFFAWSPVPPSAYPH